MKLYAGVGSRETPDDILDLMSRTATRLADLGWILRSGGANGADQAFAEGLGQSEKEIFLPWNAYNDLVPGEDGVVLTRPIPAAVEMASTVHPAWDRCKVGARNLHGRNCHIVLGHDLATPVKFVIAWTPGGKLVGGTALALRLAEREGIAVFNLYHDAARERIEKLVAGDIDAPRRHEQLRLA